jgi:hypothetical protein
VAKLVPMLGAVMAHVATPAGQAKKQRPKPKTTKYSGHKVTHGERSMSQPHQQHGELASAGEPKPLSERARMKEHAKSQMRNATESWVGGHMTTAEHGAVHARARHVLSGKHPHEFRGMSGERKIKGLR